MTDLTNDAESLECADATDPLDGVLSEAIEAHQKWDFPRAQALYLEVLQARPNDADAHHNLGVLLAVHLLRPEEALPHFEAALNARADSSQFWFSYIDALIRCQHFELARQVLPLAQTQGLQLVMANALMERLPNLSAEAVQPAAAVAPEPVVAPKPAAASSPSRPRAGKAPGTEEMKRVAAFFESRHYAAGAEAARELVRRFPRDGFGWKALGAMLHPLGQKEEALAAKKKAAALMPHDPEAACNLGQSLQDAGEYTLAETELKRALALKPAYPEALSNLGITYQKMGRVDEAVDQFRAALSQAPTHKSIFDNFLFTLNYHPDLSAKEIFGSYREYERIFGDALRSGWAPHRNDRRLGRRLKVGYVSADFGNHACRFFLEPLLARHNHAVVEVTAYSDLAKEDDVTHRYKRYVEHWVATTGMGDEALAQRIRADGIDILVDLAGHTAGNRLGVFARKPAPVSMGWMGYGYTTGLRAIDYYLTDAASAPEGSDHLFSEQPWRLADTSFTAYRAPRAAMGEVNGLPALERGYVTLGTLTRGIRINHRTVRVWAEILRRLPTAHIVIDSSSFKDHSVQEACIQKFEGQGIERGRLHVGYSSPPWDVLRGIDIGLDCFPHNSGTTLFETLYMGLPYVTLAGRPSVGRIGSAILHGVGHPEWIAQTEDDYVEKVVALASDLPALATLRAGLRGQMQASVLMDEAGFARKVELAYAQMFERWETRSV